MKKLILYMIFPNDRKLNKTIMVSEPLFNLLVAPEKTYESFLEEDQNFYDSLFDIQYEIVRTLINDRLGIGMGFTIQGTVDMTKNMLGLDIELMED